MGMTVSTFLKDDSGATAVEYGLIAALIFIAAMVSITAMSDSIINMLGFADSSVQAACASVGLC